MACRPTAWAASMVVPDPPNGSSTTPVRHASCPQSVQPVVVPTDAAKPDGAGPSSLPSRDAHPDLAVEAELPEDTRLWAALQQVGGGTWGGCVYDVDEIVLTLEAGIKARQRRDELP